MTCVICREPAVLTAEQSAFNPEMDPGRARLCAKHTDQWRARRSHAAPSAFRVFDDFVRQTQAEERNQRDTENESVRGVSVPMRGGVPAWRRP